MHGPIYASIACNWKFVGKYIYRIVRLNKKLKYAAVNSKMPRN